MWVVCVFTWTYIAIKHGRCCPCTSLSVSSSSSLFHPQPAPAPTPPPPPSRCRWPKEAAMTYCAAQIRKQTLYECQRMRTNKLRLQRHWHIYVSGHIYLSTYIYLYLKRWPEPTDDDDESDDDEPGRQKPSSEFHSVLLTWRWRWWWLNLFGCEGLSKHRSHLSKCPLQNPSDVPCPSHTEKENSI